MATRAAGDFSAVFANQGLTAFEREVYALAETLTLDGAPNQAVLIKQAYSHYLNELRLIAKEIATRAGNDIRAAERDTRVRPDTAGDGGKRLGDYLGRSYPLPDVEGSVGVNYEPPLYENVSWWWTNEEGYSGHVGRVVHGFFYETGFSGRSRPSTDQFREHPLFRAEGPQRSGKAKRQSSHQAPSKGSKGQRPGMLIKNPIPERRFVRDGMVAAEAEWHRRVRAARGHCMTQIRSVLGKAPPPRPPGLVPGRRRR